MGKPTCRILGICLAVGLWLTQNNALCGLFLTQGSINLECSFILLFIWSMVKLINRSKPSTQKKSVQKQEECLSKDGQLKRSSTFFILQPYLTQNRPSGAVFTLPWWRRARASANGLVLFLTTILIFGPYRPVTKSTSITLTSILTTRLPPQVNR